MNLTTAHLENLEKCFLTLQIFFNLTDSNDNSCQLENKKTCSMSGIVQTSSLQIAFKIHIC